MDGHKCTACGSTTFSCFECLDWDGVYYDHEPVEVTVVSTCKDCGHARVTGWSVPAWHFGVYYPI